MLAAGLVDELSLLIAPVADGRVGTPALFDMNSADAQPRRLVPEAVERLADGLLWLRYRVAASLPPADPPGHARAAVRGATRRRAR
jgi:riboflavin biosynthesis pyrimidine reductase